MSATLCAKPFGRSAGFERHAVDATDGPRSLGPRSLARQTFVDGLIRYIRRARSSAVSNTWARLQRSSYRCHHRRTAEQSLGSPRRRDHHVRMSDSPSSVAPNVVRLPRYTKTDQEEILGDGDDPFGVAETG